MSLQWLGNLAAHVVAVGVMLVFFLSLRRACKRHAFGPPTRESETACRSRARRGMGAE